MPSTTVRPICSGLPRSSNEACLPFSVRKTAADKLSRAFEQRPLRPDFGILGFLRIQRRVVLVVGRGRQGKVRAAGRGLRGGKRDVDAAVAHGLVDGADFPAEEIVVVCRARCWRQRGADDRWRPRWWSHSSRSARRRSATTAGFSSTESNKIQRRGGGLAVREGAGGVRLPRATLGSGS